MKTDVYGKTIGSDLYSIAVGTKVAAWTADDFRDTLRILSLAAVSKSERRGIVMQLPCHPKVLRGVYLESSTCLGTTNG
jgi:hypothetical protein